MTSAVRPERRLCVHPDIVRGAELGGWSGFIRRITLREPSADENGLEEQLWSIEAACGDYCFDFRRR